MKSIMTKPLCIFLWLWYSTAVFASPNAGRVADLIEKTLQQFVEDYSLREEHGENGDALLNLQDFMTHKKLGEVRMFYGEKLKKLVYIQLDDAEANLEAHLLLGFADQRSPVPHFFLDLVNDGVSTSFHVDLMPRLDLAKESAYVMQVYDPLQKYWQIFSDNSSYSRGGLSPLQETFLSPWLINVKTSSSSLIDFHQAIDGYFQQWRHLMASEAGLAKLTKLSPEQLARRDLKVRRIFFSDAVDPVWTYLDSRIGSEYGGMIRKELHSNF